MFDCFWDVLGADCLNSQYTADIADIRVFTQGGCIQMLFRGRRYLPHTTICVCILQQSDCLFLSIYIMANNPLSGAKNGGTPLLAIATEQGTVHILDTTKRRDWDYGMALLVITPTLTS